jgi:hypothetical protein
MKTPYLSGRKLVLYKATELAGLLTGRGNGTAC